MEYEIECTECGWVGTYMDLNCHPQDIENNVSVEDMRFNICPHCEKADCFEELEEEE